MTSRRNMAVVLTLIAAALLASSAVHAVNPGDTVVRFCIRGTSNNVGWSWELRPLGGGAAFDSNSAGPVPSGQGPVELAMEFVASVNSSGNPATAAVFIGDSDTAKLVCPFSAGVDEPWGAAFNISANQPFGLAVTDPTQGGAYCDVPTGGASCNFNPEITEGEPPPGNPGLGRNGAALLVVLLAAAAAALILRRRHPGVGLPA